MSVLVNKDTKVLVQGFTGKKRDVSFRAIHCLWYKSGWWRNTGERWYSTPQLTCIQHHERSGA